MRETTNIGSNAIRMVVWNTGFFQSVNIVVLMESLYKIFSMFNIFFVKIPNRYNKVDITSSIFRENDVTSAIGKILWVFKHNWFCF